MPPRQPLLTKSKFLNGLQCHKLLWHAVHTPEKFPKPDAAKQALFDQGKDVNALAQKLYPGGILIDWTAGFSEALARTRAAIARRVPVFEAGLVAENLYCRSDILRPAEGADGWDLIEVKSATQVKDEHIEDIAFQKFICDQLKIPVQRCLLLLINSAYIRRGPVNPADLLKEVDVTKSVTAHMRSLPMKLTQQKQVMNLNATPEIAIGRHCDSPYSCDLKKMCWAAVPDHHVFRLKNGGELPERLAGTGILAVRDIPDGIELTPPQAIQVEAEKTGQPHVEPERLREFLRTLVFPVHILDFETIGPAVPVFDLSRPYGTVPFQYSLHVVPALDGVSRHTCYLHNGKTDPRPEILNRLRREIGPEGSILAYNAKFEIRVLTESTDAFPEFRPWLNELLPRFADLYQPFKAFHYYHPAQNGSASLKAILPAIVGKSYAALAIGAGELASNEFFRVTFGESSDEDRSRVREALEIYCKKDTESLIEILQELDRLSAAG